MNTSQKSWIDEANELIDIADVLTTIGVFVPETIRNGGNRKLHCPFGFYHSDGGLAKAMRLYRASNTVYCFSCSKRYSPVTLAAAKWDCSWNNAALQLLEDAGVKRKTLEERWTDAITPEIVKVDTIALAEALKMYCSAISSNWNILQLEEDVAVQLNKCLTLLKVVTTEDEAYRWLTTCKQVMKKMLEE